MVTGDWVVLRHVYIFRGKHKTLIIDAKLKAYFNLALQKQPMEWLVGFLTAEIFS